MTPASSSSRPNLPLLDMSQIQPWRNVDPRTSHRSVLYSIQPGISSRLRAKYALATSRTAPAPGWGIWSENRSTSRPASAPGWGIWSKNRSISEQHRSRRRLRLLSTQHSRHQRSSPELWAAQYYRLPNLLSVLRATPKDEFDLACHAHSPRPVAPFGSTSVGPPESFRAAGNRAAQGLTIGLLPIGAVLILTDYGAMSPLENSIDPIPPFEQEVRSGSAYPTRIGGASTATRHRSSLEDPTSTASYSNYDTNAPSTTASGRRNTQLSLQSKARLDPSTLFSIVVVCVIANNPKENFM
ncbi:MAG: hypothetical protein Q9200_005482 [Gallowayella weberi]